MEQYIARQPILNVHKKLFGYELLYVGAHDYTLSRVSGDRATSSVLSSTFLTADVTEISSNRPCFINFTQELLEKNIPASFPSSQIVVEILEDVTPTEKVIATCRQLNKAGYRIALDDFVFDRKLHPLLELAHIVKIDVRLTPLDTILKTLKRLSHYNIKLLAEKVETRDEFEKAHRLGFSYFQGYFFSRPERIEITEMSAAKTNLVRLLSELSSKKTTFKKLHDIIVNDISISYKLLRFLNSAYFYRLQKIESVKHAIAYLGEKELRRFLLLVVISEIASDQPLELIRLVLVRAKFCELLGEASPYHSNSNELFMLGLFSALDTMLKSTMKKVMEKLPLSKEVKEALSEGSGIYAKFLKTAIAFERTQSTVVFDNIEELQIKKETIQKSYVTALKYANGLM
ncbi:MAG: EAL domain-containing protein [Desulfocapsaceae bacterium]|jgi:EAL and modified HD-GYP domain-containing signal transduction protein|nr:EAL domain-containing protein [Desulfocapsaceae bacterium]